MVSLISGPSTEFITFTTVFIVKVIMTVEAFDPEPFDDIYDPVKFLKMQRIKRKRLGIKRKSSKSKIRQTMFMMAEDDPDEEDVQEICPSKGISAFSFVNFILSSVMIGHNVISNINNNQNNNNDNNNNNNDNSANFNIGSNNNMASNNNDIKILPGGRKKRSLLTIHHAFQQFLKGNLNP